MQWTNSIIRLAKAITRMEIGRAIWTDHRRQLTTLGNSDAVRRLFHIDILVTNEKLISVPKMVIEAEECAVQLQRETSEKSAKHQG